MQQTYLYQERSLESPELAPPETRSPEAIGKIFTRIRPPRKAPQDLDNSQDASVRLGNGLDYSQLLNNIRIDGGNPTSAMKQESRVTSVPYSFQSALDLGVRPSFQKKALPSLSPLTPSEREASFVGSESATNAEPRPRRVSKQFRINEHREKSDFSKLSQSQSEIQLVDHRERRYQQSLSNHIQNAIKKQQEEPPLKNSRSIGIGDYMIDRKDLQSPQDEQNQINQVPSKIGSSELSQQQQFPLPIISKAKHDENQKLTKMSEIKRQIIRAQMRDQQYDEEFQGISLQHPVQLPEKGEEPQTILSNSPIDASRLASTIKADEPVDGIEATPDEKSDHQLLIDLQQSQSKDEPIENPSTFSLDEYNKAYQILKAIVVCLRSPTINIQQLLKSIKKYLEVVASGSLDNIDEFDIALHKKKVIKHSLFLERVAVITVAFAYATHALKTALKYLINIVNYSITNCLILSKVLQETQVSRPEGEVSGACTPALHKSERSVMKKSLDVLRNNNNVLVDAVSKLSKHDESYSLEFAQILKSINKFSLEHSFYGLLEYFAQYLSQNQRQSMIPFLAVAPNPYLAPAAAKDKYTLVIDCMELFCHGTSRSKTSTFRPYAQHFLQEMSQYYEIISFCPALPAQVDKVIDLLDPKGHIQHRLYKHHSITTSNHHVKCVDRIGRDADRTILLDNENVGGAGSLDNCIHVPAWRGSRNDTVLAELCPLLAMIAIKKMSARQTVKQVRRQALKNRSEGVKYINFGLFLQ